MQVQKFALFSLLLHTLSSLITALPTLESNDVSTNGQGRSLAARQLSVSIDATTSAEPLVYSVSEIYSLLLPASTIAPTTAPLSIPPDQPLPVTSPSMNVSLSAASGFTMTSVPSPTSTGVVTSTSYIFATATASITQETTSMSTSTKAVSSSTSKAAAPTFVAGLGGMLGIGLGVVAALWGC